MGDKNTANDLDQVRELIFGEQSRQNQQKFAEVDHSLNELNKNLSSWADKTEQKFKKMEKDARRMQDELESLIEKTKSELAGSLESVRAQILKRIDQLADDKTDRMQLGNFLIELGMRLKGEDLMETLKKGAKSE